MTMTMKKRQKCGPATCIECDQHEWCERDAEATRMQEPPDTKTPMESQNEWAQPPDTSNRHAALRSRGWPQGQQCRPREQQQRRRRRKKKKKKKTQRKKKEGQTTQGPAQATCANEARTGAGCQSTEPTCLKARAAASRNCKPTPLYRAATAPTKWIQLPASAARSGRARTNKACSEPTEPEQQPELPAHKPE